MQLPLQLVCPVGQDTEQEPSAQTSPCLQVVPQPPQWLRLALGLTHVSPHRICPVGHPEEHVPARHCSPSAQLLPQAPQFFALVMVSTQLLLQLVRLVWHDVLHCPRLQTCPAAHALPQAPQFVESTMVSMQRLSQRVCPTGHVAGFFFVVQFTNVPATIMAVNRWKVHLNPLLVDIISPYFLCETEPWKQTEGVCSN